MSIVRKLVGELMMSRSNRETQSPIQATLAKVKFLKIQQLQQFFREISHLIYQREENANNQLLALKIIKQLLINGSYAVYLFSNVYIFQWVVSICNFQQTKKIDQRALLLYKEITGKNIPNHNTNIQSFKFFLSYAEEFLVFFGQNLKFYPYSKYKIKNIFAKELPNGQYTRSLSQFTNFDLSNLQSNLKKRGVLFRDELSEFTDFLNFKLEQSLQDSSKYHENVFLMSSLVQIGESYCISIIEFRLCTFLVPDRISIACQIIDLIISTAEIEAIDAINVRCLPLILEYLLPVDFKEHKVLQLPKIMLQGQTLNKLINYYYGWYEKTKILKLSTKIYECSYAMIEYLKKPFKLSYQNQLKEFSMNLQKIQQNNQVKRAFIIDQHQQQEQRMANLLKEVAFCVNSQKVQRQVAYENVLDELTITQKSSVSQFGQSLLKSAKQRQQGESIQNKSENSRSGRTLKSSSRMSSRKSKLSHQANEDQRDKQQIQNIYYYKDGLSSHKVLTGKQTSEQNLFSNKGQLQSFQNRKIRFQDNYYHKECQSYADVLYPSLPKVTAKDSRGGKNNAYSSSKSDISLHSSQFSQKDNNQQHKYNKPIQSIYLDRSNKNQNSAQVNQSDRSGQFLYFEKESQVKSEKNLGQKSNKHSLQQDEIEFEDSLKIVNQSQSGQIIQFGMDVNAKIPQTLTKPKFNFKNIETNDSQMILKEIQSPRSQNMLLHIQTPTNKQASIPKNKNLQSRKNEKKSKESDIKINIAANSNVKRIKSVESDYFNSPKIINRQSILQSLHLHPLGQSSGSIIKQNSGQPHLISQSISLSNQKFPSKFGEVFRQKSEKASALSSSRSLKRLRQIPQRQVQIPDFKKLRNLQNQLGKLKNQTDQYNKQLEEKNKEMMQLKKKQKQLIESDPYFLKKQNEIMKILLKNKDKNQPVRSSQSSAKNLTKQLKESSIKNYNMSLKDYNNEMLKLKFSNIKGLTKEQKKSIVSNRCILLKNYQIEIGYSFKNNEVTLYLTLKNYCDSLQINLMQNSVNFSQSIRRSFDKLYVGKQMKFKTEVNQTKQNNNFVPAAVIVKVTYQSKLQLKNEQFTCELPLTPYNMAKPLSSSEAPSLLSQSKNQRTAYITPLYNSSEDLVKKGKPYLLKMFPHGTFNEDSTVFTIIYQWKNTIETINIKLKQRAFRIQGIGYPMQSGRELIETVINLLIDNP